ncbi:MAG: type IV pilin protein [Candidatus Avelusimicrobium sp.]|uniref:type IV pilin protein n=1 Tax=Candidatus Avelusimicrobium sp. TaxID=3048833 RepID=UPI003F09C37B
MKGFTLIELLVVVLIIGILASVALPQYQMAVEKSRIAQVASVLKAAKEAEEVYYMANGAYTSDMDSLDVSWKCPEGWECALGYDINGGGAIDKVEAVRLDRNLGIVYSFERRSDKPQLANLLYCWARPSSSLAVKICKSMGPALVSDGTYQRYRIQ